MTDRAGQSSSSTVTQWVLNLIRGWLQVTLARSWMAISWTWPRWVLLIGIWPCKPILVQLSQIGLMVPGSPGYNPRPTEAERMHCVAFVISAISFSAMYPLMEEKLKAVLKEARARCKAHLILASSKYLCRPSSSCHPDKYWQALLFDRECHLQSLLQQRSQRKGVFNRNIVQGTSVKMFPRWNQVPGGRSEPQAGVESKPSFSSAQLQRGDRVRLAHWHPQPACTAADPT